MPFALLLIGLLIIVTSIRGTQGDLWNLLYKDVAGTDKTPGFVVWLAAVIAIAWMGYYKPLQTPSRMLLGLVVLSIFLANGGVFKKLSDAFTKPLPAPVASTTPVDELPQKIPVDVSGTGSSKSSSKGDIIGTAVKTALPLILA
jgi:hypothetical protein